MQDSGEEIRCYDADRQKESPMIILKLSRAEPWWRHKWVHWRTVILFGFDER